MPDGFRTFVAGEKFLAARLMGYLMEQVIAVFATTAARDLAITAPEEGQHCFIAGTYDLWQEYTGAAWITYRARGSGTPEGNVTATVGCLYQRTDGTGGTTIYIKESGSGNTGWVALVSATTETAVWIDASELNLIAGTPVMSPVETGGTPGWLLDGSADEYVGKIWRVPVNWAAFDLDAYWSNTSTSAGNVNFASRRRSTAIADGVDQGDLRVSLQTATEAAPTVIGEIEVTTVSTSTDTAVTAGSLYQLLIGRRGSDVLDTLNAIDICLHGILLRKV